MNSRRSRIRGEGSYQLVSSRLQHLEAAAALLHPPPEGGLPSPQETASAPHIHHPAGLELAARLRTTTRAAAFVRARGENGFGMCKPRSRAAGL